MIPLRLKAQNFMAYRELDLDFTAFKIACLSGQNGAGKSTILDALTWALFESSRATDREDIIRLGEKEARVELTFQLENQIYRIIRSKARKKGKSSGKAGLEFQQQGKSGFRALTGKRKSDTQKLIEETLHMDYNLFVNSSFMLQGKADVFTTSRPEARKQVLADILNLQIYDRLQEAARQKRLRYKNEKNVNLGRLQQLNKALESEPYIVEQLKGVQQAHQDLETRITKAQTHFQSCLQEIETLSVSQNQLTQLQNQHQQTQARLAQLNQEDQELQAALTEVDKLYHQRQTIESRYQQLLSLKAERETLEKQHEQLLAYQSSHRDFTQKTTQARHQLELEMRQAQQALSGLNRELALNETLIKQAAKIETEYQKFCVYQAEENQYQLKYTQFQTQDALRQELEKKESTCLEAWRLELQRMETLASEKQALIEKETNLESEWQEVSETVQSLEAQQTELDQIKTAGQEKKHAIEHAQQKASEFKVQIQEAHEKIAKFKAHQDLECPLCERMLTQEEAQVLIDKYQGDIQTYEGELAHLNTQIKAWDTEKAELGQAYTRLMRALKRLKSLTQRLGELEKRRALLAEAKASLNTIQGQIQAKQGLTLTELAPELAQEIAQVREAIRTLAFDPNEYQLVQNRRKDASSAEKDYQDLQKAQAQANTLTPQIQSLEQQVNTLQKQLDSKSYAKDWETEISDLEAKIAELATVPEQLKGIKERLKIGQQYQDLYDRLQQALTQRAMLHEQAEKQNREMKKLVSQCEAEKQDIADLSHIPGELAAKQEAKSTAEIKLNDLRVQEKNLHAQLYALEKEQDLLSDQREEWSGLKLASESIEEELKIYDELNQIFGKNGIQAVVIENAIPEIEHAANTMLSQMTDGRMHVKFQTLRSLKSDQDKLRETLEILISDEMGTRNYETFSAGEAFRVNFAIRLAISQLLARRSGARLQTLVVDEGFGTQDSHGKTRLIEAINTVAAQFETILVITHVDELKSLFPCRLEVAKHPEGSVVQLMT